MILDDRPSDVPRIKARERLDAHLVKPLDPEEREAYEEETWGLQPDQIDATASFETDEAFA